MFTYLIIQCSPQYFFWSPHTVTSRVNNRDLYTSTTTWMSKGSVRFLSCKGHIRRWLHHIQTPHPMSPRVWTPSSSNLRGQIVKRLRLPSRAKPTSDGLGHRRRTEPTAVQDFVALFVIMRLSDCVYLQANSQFIAPRECRQTCSCPGIGGAMNYWFVCR